MGSPAPPRPAPPRRCPRSAPSRRPDGCPARARRRYGSARAGSTPTMTTNDLRPRHDDGERDRRDMPTSGAGRGHTPERVRPQPETSTDAASPGRANPNAAGVHQPSRSMPRRDARSPSPRVPCISYTSAVQSARWRGLAHFTRQLGVGDRAGITRLALPVEGDLLTMPRLDMPVDAVDRHVELPAHEPPRERRLPHPVPPPRPRETLGRLRPRIPPDLGGTRIPVLGSVGPRELRARREATTPGGQLRQSGRNRPRLRDTRGPAPDDVRWALPLIGPDPGPVRRCR